ncbi:MAG: hypothetical protein QXF45_05700, partial [Candidatus Caldarchaeum sp.]
GDNLRTAKAVASKIGIDEIYAEVLPDQKAAAVTDERSKGRVVVIEKSVEDWIVANECIDPRRENALKYLKHQHRYEKYKLPGYRERIDPEKLAQK